MISYHCHIAAQLANRFVPWIGLELFESCQQLDDHIVINVLGIRIVSPIILRVVRGAQLVLDNVSDNRSGVLGDDLHNKAL